VDFQVSHRDDNLGGQLRDLLDMLIQNMLVIWTGEDHSQVTCLLLAIVL
jgi:hypothetical protein